MVRSVCTGFDEACDRVGQVRYVSRRTDLIVRHAQFRPRSIRAHRQHKSLSRLPVEPCGANDVVPWVKFTHSYFAGQLARAIDTHGIGEITLVVRSVRRAVKYVVSRHMNQRNSEVGSLCGKILGPQSISGVSAGDLRFRTIDIVESGGIYHEIRLLTFQHFMDLA